MGLKSRTKPEPGPALHPLVERLEAGARYTLAELKQTARALNPEIPNERFRALVGALTAEGQLTVSGQRAAARWARAGVTPA